MMFAGGVLNSSTISNSIFLDTFNDVGGVNLTAHQPDSGVSIPWLSGGTSNNPNNMVISTNSSAKANVGNSQNHILLPSVNFYAKINLQGAYIGGVGIMCNWQGGGAWGYGDMVWLGSTAAFQYYRLAGSPSKLVSFSNRPSAVPFLIEIQSHNGTLKFRHSGGFVYNMPVTYPTYMNFGIVSYLNAGEIFDIEILPTSGSDL